MNIPGGNDGEATPVPIPNTVVKLSGAENTWLATAWENRELPGQKSEAEMLRFFDKKIFFELKLQDC